MPDFLIPDPIRIQQYRDNMDFNGSLLEVGTGSGIPFASATAYTLRRLEFLRIVAVSK